MIIHKKWSIPYHAYGISHQKLLSQIFSITQGVCNRQIPLQYMIIHLSVNVLANILRSIQKFLKKSSIVFTGDNNTQKMITYNETRLAVAIADIINSEGLYFNLYQKPRSKKVLALSRTVSKCYQPPNRKLISKDLLNVIHDQNTESNLSLIKKSLIFWDFYF